MDRTTYLLLCLMEECAEVQQRVTKALRFGLDEVQEGQLHNNRERLVMEFTDLLAVADELHNFEGISLLMGSRAAKKKKLRKYMAYSEQVGVLTSAEV